MDFNNLDATFFFQLDTSTSLTEDFGQASTIVVTTIICVCVSPSNMNSQCESTPLALSKIKIIVLL